MAKSYMVDLSDVYTDIISDYPLFLKLLKNDMIHTVGEHNERSITSSIDEWVKELVLTSLSDCLNSKINRFLGSKGSSVYLIEKSIAQIPQFKWLNGQIDTSISDYVDTVDYANGYSRRVDTRDPKRINYVTEGNPDARDSLEDFLCELNSGKILEHSESISSKYNRFTCYSVEVLGSLSSIRVSITGDYRIMEWEKDHMRDGKYVG